MWGIKACATAAAQGVGIQEEATGGRHACRCMLAAIVALRRLVNNQGRGSRASPAA